MPKKTKKEKIIALYRRKLKLLGEVQKISPTNKKLSPQQNFTTNSQQEKIELNIEEKRMTNFLLTDLKKSLILTGVIVALEICLYFVRIIK